MNTTRTLFFWEFVSGGLTVGIYGQMVTRHLVWCLRWRVALLPSVWQVSPKTPAPVGRENPRYDFLSWSSRLVFWLMYSCSRLAAFNCRAVYSLVADVRERRFAGRARSLLLKAFFCFRAGDRSTSTLVRFFEFCWEPSFSYALSKVRVPSVCCNFREVSSVEVSTFRHRTSIRLYSHRRANLQCDGCRADRWAQSR
jgi:hypothetical protein